MLLTKSFRDWGSDSVLECLLHRQDIRFPELSQTQWNFGHAANCNPWCYHNVYDLADGVQVCLGKDAVTLRRGMQSLVTWNKKTGRGGKTKHSCKAWIEFGTCLRQTSIFLPDTIQKILILCTITIKSSLSFPSGCYWCFWEEGQIFLGLTYESHIIFECVFVCVLSFIRQFHTEGAIIKIIGI